MKRPCLTQRAVAIPALGWRLRVGATANLSLRIHVKAGHNADLLGQSPLPGGGSAWESPALEMPEIVSGSARWEQDRIRQEIYLGHLKPHRMKPHVSAASLSIRRGQFR